MQRKWTVLAATMAACSALVVGIAAADDDEKSPLHQGMEKIQKHYLAITKNTRNAPNFAKKQKDVVDSATVIAKVAKDVKPIKDAVKKVKDVANADAEWDKYMDDLIKSSQNLATVAGKAGATHDQAKQAFNAVKKTCTDCHGVFRKDDE
jgi:uncharacterized tellurite resistance protein B-like protein